MSDFGLRPYVQQYKTKKLHGNSNINEKFECLPNNVNHF